MSWLTDSELEAIKSLPQSTPYVIQGVSLGFFSIARRYGGMTIQGDRYSYMPTTDECVRNDVVRFVKKLRRKPKGMQPAANSETFSGTKDFSTSEGKTE